MKLDIIFHYNVDEITGNITYIGKEEITVDTVEKTVRKTSAKVEENKEPLITLDSNKLILTTGAIEFMKLEPGCRVDIKYKKRGNKSLPVIGTDESFGTKGGNVLHKNNTISFRGSANSKLEEYGISFKLETSEENGIFYLIGDKMNNPIPDDSIDIESELNIESLDVIDNDLNLESFDFTL